MGSDRGVNLNPGPEAVGILASGTVLNLFGTVYSTLGRLVFSVVLARLLAPDSLGVYFLALTVANIVGIVSVGGFDLALVRYIALYRAEQRWAVLRGTLRFSLRAVGGMSLLAAIVLGVGAPWIASVGFGKPELTRAFQVVAFAIPLFALEMAILSATQAFKEMKHKVWIDSVLNPTLKIGLTILLVSLGWGLFGALAAYLTTLATCLVLALKALGTLVRTGPHTPELSCNRAELLAYATPLVGVAIATGLLQYIDTLILARLRPVDEVGVYSICLRIAFLTGFALPVVSQIFAPFIAELHHRRENDRLEELFKLVTLWAFELFLPLALILSVGAPALLSLFGGSFRSAAPVFVLLLLGQFVNIVTGPVGIVLTMTGQSRLQFYNSLLALFLQCGAAVVLIPSWGLLGAAAANVAGITCVNLARIVETYWLLHFHPFSFSLAKPFLAAGTALLVTSPLWIHGNSASYGRLSLVCLAILLVYAGVLVSFGFDAASRLAWRELRTRFARLPDKVIAPSVGGEGL